MYTAVVSCALIALVGVGCFMWAILDLLENYHNDNDPFGTY